MDSDNFKEPKTDIEDTINTIVKVGLSTIPVIGGPALEIFNAIVKSPIEKRRSKLIESIIEKIITLEKEFKGLTPENLSKNELFITVLLNATQAALKEHQKEKINSLKNAIINTVTLHSVGEQHKLLFLNYIESFTVIHILVFKYYHNENNRSGSLHYKNLKDKYDFFCKAFPGTGIEPSTFLSISQELEDKDLIKRQKYYSHDDGTFISYCTERTRLGDKFFNFITGHFDD